MSWAKVQSVNAAVDGSGKITLTLNSVGAGNLLTCVASYYRLGTGANVSTPPAVPADTNGTMVGRNVDMAALGFLVRCIGTNAPSKEPNR